MKDLCTNSAKVFSQMPLKPKANADQIQSYLNHAFIELKQVPSSKQKVLSKLKAFHHAVKPQVESGGDKKIEQIKSNLLDAITHIEVRDGPA